MMEYVLIRLVGLSPKILSSGALGSQDDQRQLWHDRYTRSSLSDAESLDLTDDLKVNEQEHSGQTKHFLHLQTRKRKEGSQKPTQEQDVQHY